MEVDGRLKTPTLAVKQKELGNIQASAVFICRSAFITSYPSTSSFHLIAASERIKPTGATGWGPVNRTCEGDLFFPNGSCCYRNAAQVEEVISRGSKRQKNKHARASHAHGRAEGIKTNECLYAESLLAPPSGGNYKPGRGKTPEPR